MTINNISLVSELENSYLSYSLAAIKRAIPDFRDGLIPIHRRVVWAAYKGGFSSDGKTKKSARLDGDIVGKFSPHGSAYGSIVTLTSTWNNNYPLLEGQGNFGSSVDTAAAGRYTETKLQKFTEEVLLDELDNLELKPNYDNSTTEPIYLNAKLPLLLLKGQTSIAVGYSTNIPQYNLEAISKYLLGDKNTKLIPDFPTNPLIYINPDNPNSILQRAKITNKVEETIGKRKKKEYLRVEFSNLPYGSNPEKIGEQIKNIVQTEKLLSDDIIAVNDLSDRNGDCLEVVLSKNREREILSIIYKYSDLQLAFNVNFTILVDGIPKTMEPLEYLDLWKEWRMSKIVEYYSLLLEKQKENSLLISEIIKVLSDKKGIIKILDNPNLSVKDCQREIVEKYKISQKSTEFFLSLPIKKLMSLEVEKYKEELSSINKSIDESQKIINNPLNQFKREIKYFSNKYKINRKQEVFKPETEKKESASGKKTNINGFSIDKNKGIIKKGSEYFEPVIVICSNGFAYRVGLNQRGPITSSPVKILYVLKDGERNNSNDLIEIKDTNSKLGKCIKINLLSATSKGVNLGFESITSVGINNKSKLKVSGKTTKPKKYE